MGPDDSISRTVGPGGIVHGTVDELPPPYTSVTGGAPMVTCRVCQVIQDFCLSLSIFSKIKISMVDESFNQINLPILYIAGNDRHCWKA